MYNAPRTWVTGELVSSGMMNQHVRDNFLATNPVPSTALPGGPTDGDRAVLVDSTTNPSYQFLFRYNAGSSSVYKWECLGCGGFLEGTTAITLPRAGDWYVEIGGAAQAQAAGTNTQITLTASGVSLAAFQGSGGGGTQGIDTSIFDKARMNALGGGGTLTPTVAGSPVRQYIRAQPVRCS